VKKNKYFFEEFCMKTLDSGKDKIQKICDVLKKETIQPAKQEAKEIVENAHLQANEIIKAAKEKTAKLLEKAKEKISQEEKIFQSSLNIAAQQSIDELKLKIEEKIFNENLFEVVNKELENPKIIAELITVIIKALDESGLDSDLSAYIGKTIKPKAVIELLIERVKEQLQETEIQVADFSGGIKIKLKNSKITIDISSDSVKNLISRYIRDDFRNIIFNV
jgi:V/A-type H+/Na+-transporting ATPase subunit E